MQYIFSLGISNNLSCVYFLKTTMPTWLSSTYATTDQTSASSRIIIIKSESGNGTDLLKMGAGLILKSSYCDCLLIG